MAESDVRRILFALQRTVEFLFPTALRDRNEISAEELREFVQNELEKRCNSSRNCRRYWKPLTKEQKISALRIVVPDGVYPRQVEEDLLEDE